MKKIVFKSVYDLDSVKEFAEELTYEIVCSKEEAPSVEDILNKFGYYTPAEDVGDYDEDFEFDIENDFDYDIIDAYEDAVALQAKLRESKGTDPQKKSAGNDNEEKETEIKEQRDDEDGTDKEDRAN